MENSILSSIGADAIETPLVKDKLLSALLY